MTEVLDKLRSVTHIYCDCDGVLTDAKTVLSRDSEFRTFCLYDGTGVRLLRACGVVVTIISSDCTGLCRKRAEHLKVPYICSARQMKKKLIPKDLFVSSLYIGDDLNDIEAGLNALVSACPSTAPSYMQTIFDLTLKTGGGEGVLLEVAYRIFEAKNIDIIAVAKVLARELSSRP